MADDLIGTAEVAKRLGVSVATVNRWQDDAEDAPQAPLTPAVVIPGPKRAAARLYRSEDVQAAWDRRVTNAIDRGACVACTTFTRQVWHNGDPCPSEQAVAS